MTGNATKTKQKKYYRLMVGNYSHLNRNGGNRELVKYRKSGEGAGSVILTDRDLLRLNTPRAPKKFERLSESEAKRIMRLEAKDRDAKEAAAREAEARADDFNGDDEDGAGNEEIKEVGLPPGDPLATLDVMTLEELKRVAAGEEIDLKGAKSKDDALKIMKKALAPAVK